MKNCLKTGRQGWRALAWTCLRDTCPCTLLCVLHRGTLHYTHTHTQLPTPFPRHTHTHIFMKAINKQCIDTEVIEKQENKRSWEWLPLDVCHDNHWFTIDLWKHLTYLNNMHQYTTEKDLENVKRRGWDIKRKTVLWFLSRQFWSQGFFCQILVPRTAMPSLMGTLHTVSSPNLSFSTGNTVCVTIKTGKLCASWEMNEMLWIIYRSPWD